MDALQVVSCNWYTHSTILCDLWLILLLFSTYDFHLIQQVLNVLTDASCVWLDPTTIFFHLFLSLFLYFFQNSSSFSAHSIRLNAMENGNLSESWAEHDDEKMMILVTGIQLLRHKDFK